MNKVVEVLRRERAELAELGNQPGEAPEQAFDCRRRMGEIEELLRDFEEG
jgi:hypothetical protein